MTGNYQMTDAIGMPGGVLEVGYDGPEVVVHIHGGRQARLTAEGQERFARAYVTACREAEAAREAAARTVRAQACPGDDEAALTAWAED